MTRRRIETPPDFADRQHVDPQTGLQDATSFTVTLKQEHDKICRQYATYAVLLVEIDEFTMYTQDFGEQAGETLLHICADTIRTCCRNTDFISRIHGCRFGLILADTTADLGVRVAHRIMREIRNLNLPPASSARSEYITVSCGISGYDPNDGPDRSGDVILKEASTALDSSLRAGGNAAFRAGSPPRRIDDPLAPAYTASLVPASDVVHDHQ